jgi:hypothetical protein
MELSVNRARSVKNADEVENDDQAERHAEKPEK